MTRSPFLWTFSPTQHVRKTGFSSLLFPAADGPRGAPRGPSSPHTSHALYRYPYAFSQFRDCPVTIDSHPGRQGWCNVTVAQGMGGDGKKEDLTGPGWDEYRRTPKVRSSMELLQRLRERYLQFVQVVVDVVTAEVSYRDFEER